MTTPSSFQSQYICHHHRRLTPHETTHSMKMFPQKKSVFSYIRYFHFGYKYIDKTVSASCLDIRISILFYFKFTHYHCVCVSVVCVCVCVWHCLCTWWYQWHIDYILFEWKLMVFVSYYYLECTRVVFVSRKRKTLCQLSRKTFRSVLKIDPSWI